MTDLIDNFQGKYEIKNGDHSPFAIENSTLNCDNKKLTDSIFILMDQLTKLISQQILIMQNQNELFKDFIKIKKAG